MLPDHKQMADFLGVHLPESLPRKRTFEGADGVRLNALDWGGTGPNCLFLHGGALSAHTWTQCCLLLRQNYRCICLDLRGHGESDWADDYTIAAQVADVLSVLQSLGWSSLHLIGMSLGGVVAAHAATALKDQPPNSLTLVDVAPGVALGDLNRIRAFLGADTVTGGPDALVTEAKQRGTRLSRTELMYRYLSLTRPLPDGGWAWRHDSRHPPDFPHIIAHMDRMAELAPDWPMPCLIVRGARSRTLSEETADTFARHCRDARVVAVSGAGHSVQEDSPRELAGVLTRFWGPSSTRTCISPPSAGI